MRLSLQGYFAYKKRPPRRTLQSDHAYAPMAVLGGAAIPDERGNPVVYLLMGGAGLPNTSWRFKFHCQPLLNLRHGTVNLGRPERARHEGTTVGYLEGFTKDPIQYNQVAYGCQALEREWWKDALEQAEQGSLTANSCRPVKLTFSKPFYQKLCLSGSRECASSILIVWSNRRWSGSGGRILPPLLYTIYMYLCVYIYI